MPEGERDRLERYPEFAPAGMPGRAYTADTLLDGGEAIDVAGISFECISIPGHSPAHVAYYTEGHLFSGDLLFAGSVGRVDLPGADWDTLLASVRMLADRFPPETVVYPGHGGTTTLGDELARNPFLAELRA
jgi:glyoxylase-like metal-dependent hydrolase (beta-lactamase superfamily II)